MRRFNSDPRLQFLSPRERESESRPGYCQRGPLNVLCREAFGQSKAVHHAHARKAQVALPLLEDHEKKTAASSPIKLASQVVDFRTDHGRRPRDQLALDSHAESLAALRSRSIDRSPFALPTCFPLKTAAS